jgi:hypothetical protein
VTVAYAQPRTATASNVLRPGLRARPHGPFSAVVPVSREAVHEARGALLDLAERLRGPRPVAPHGVRVAQQLLADGAGPLYVPADHGDLRAAALLALGALDAHGAGG